MNKRLMVKDELLQILSFKYKVPKEVIEKEIDLFLKGKNKLTVEDLDSLEEKIRDACGLGPGVRTVIRGVNKSVDLPEERQEAKNLRYSERSNVESPLKKSGIKIVERNKDHLLFPSDSNPHHTLQPSPTKRKINENDDWGKIVHADHLCYLSEEKFIKLEKKKQQARYREILLAQIAQKSPNRAKLDNLHKSQSNEAKAEKVSKVFKEKEWLDEIVQRKREETESKFKEKLREQQQLKEIWAKQEEDEVEKTKKLRKIRESVAKEQCIQASAKKKCKHLVKEYEKSHSKSMIEETIKKINESEKAKLALVQKRLQFVHDDDRLKKLMPQLSTSSKCDQNSSFTSHLPSLSDIQTSSFLSKLFESESPRPKNRQYLSDLQAQISEKKQRDEDYVRLQREQGHIWAAQDAQALEAEHSKRLLRKKTQKALFNEYSAKVALKKAQRQQALQLSPSEVGMNRKLFHSSLALLDS